MQKRFKVYFGIFILYYIFLMYPLKSQTGSDYFPLDLNNKWIFSHTFYDSIPETIVDTQSIGANLYYQFDQFREDQDVLFTQLGQQVFRYVDSQISLWYHFGVDTGTSWTAEGSNGVQWIVTLLSKNDTVITTAGTWTDCYRFTFTGVPDYEWEEWLAPGVGIVRRNLYGIVLSEWLLIDKTITSIAIGNKSSEIEMFTLHQNYPNPFNPITTIEFDLLKTSEVSLKVFNILGEEVTTLVSDRLSADSYSYQWDSSNLASGVYLYRLQAGDYVETRKMVLMR